MADYTIRAITLHYRVKSSLYEEITTQATQLLEAKDYVVSETGLDIESVRTTIAGVKAWDVDVEKLGEIGSDSGILLSIGSLTVNEAKKAGKDALRSLAENNVFFNILLDSYSRSEARFLSEIIHYMAEIDPSLPTKFGVNVYGKRILTPYFPLSDSETLNSPGITASLTYPNYLANAYRSKGYGGLLEAVEVAGKKAAEIGERVARLVNAKFIGVDLSVAPWMKESSLGLVELIAGVRMPEPGFLYGIYTVNRALTEASLKLKRTVGFNEVQLPIAEDLKLKARVSELETTARDLARFTCVCLAGLDLAVVPADIDGVAGLLLDTRACALTKNKVLGVRVVPVEDVEPGDKVWLGKFGETPVIPL